MKADGLPVESAWVAAALGAVGFASTLMLLVQVLAARQNRTGRPSRLLRVGAVPGGVPVVVAAVVGVAVATLARASTLGAVIVVALVLASLGATVLATRGRHLRRK